MSEDLQPCLRCGYNVESDRQRKLSLGHIGHRLRAMLYVEDLDEARFWVCEYCHAPGEEIQQIEKRSAFPEEPLVA